MTRTNDATYAAEKAGYAHPVHAGSNVMRRDGVRNEVLRRQRERIETEGIAVAVDFTIKAVGEERFPPGVRLQAAKLLMDHALKDAGAGNETPAHEMTPDQLAKAIAELQRIAADRAKPVIDHAEPGILD